MPPEFAAVMIAFQPLFSKRVYDHASTLVAGAILTPGRRTVTNARRVMGLDQMTTFQNYHRVLNRATWSPAQASRVLLRLLISAFSSAGPLVFGIDDTIERRWGKRIQARGIYRDPVRSSHGHFVKASGLRWLSLMLRWLSASGQRWLSLMLRCEVPWARRVWALPFLTVLCPSERYNQARGKTHKKLTDYARQMTLQLRRWLPDRHLIVVGDSSFAALELLASVRAYATMVTRLRLDAALYEPAPPRRPGQVGRPRKKGKRLPTLKQVLTDSKTSWLRVFVSPWYGRLHGRTDQCHGGVVSHGHGPGAAALGPGARSCGPTRSEGIPVYGSGCWPRGDSLVVRASLECRSDFCRSPPSLGRRDPAAVVEYGDSAYDAVLVGSVLARYADG